MPTRPRPGSAEYAARITRKRETQALNTCDRCGFKHAWKSFLYRGIASGMVPYQCCSIACAERLKQDGK